MCIYTEKLMMTNMTTTFQCCKQVISQALSQRVTPSRLLTVALPANNSWHSPLNFVIFTKMSTGRMSDEQFAKLLATIRALGPQHTEQQQKQPIGKSKSSFSNCSVSFYGQRDNDAVEEFINAIETYKDMEDISDQDALKGLPLLFHGIASTWWKGVRRDAKSWQDALTLLRDHFSPTKPPYQIYVEIFESKQAGNTPIDTFVCQKRALIAKLPEGRHDVETELDFVYGLLDSKYQQQIPRHTVKTYRELLEKGRNVERHSRRQ